MPPPSLLSTVWSAAANGTAIGKPLAPLPLNTAKTFGHARPISALVSAARLVVKSGTYPATILVRDQYHSYTAPPSIAQTERALSLAVIDYDYQITPPANDSFYMFPTNSPRLATDPTTFDPDYIYNYPGSYIAQLAVPQEARDMGLAWSLTTNPPNLGAAMPGLNISLNQEGLIDASAIDSPVPAGGFNFSVTARAVTSYCQVARETTFPVSLLLNQWCGDSLVNGTEECDDGRDGDNTNQCDDYCRFTRCGDNIVQSPNGHGFNEECDEHTSRCAMPGSLPPRTTIGCTLTYCGDGQAQRPNGADFLEECDGQDLGGATCASLGYDAGILSCVNTDCVLDTDACYNYCRFGIDYIGSCLFAS